MRWETHSKSGFVKSLKILRKGKNPSTIRYYFSVVISESASVEASDSDETFTLPEESSNTVGYINNEIIHAAIISALREAMCEGKRVSIVGEKLVLDEGEYPDSIILQYLHSLPYPLITSLELIA